MGAKLIPKTELIYFCFVLTNEHETLWILTKNSQTHTSENVEYVNDDQGVLPQYRSQ